MSHRRQFLRSVKPVGSVAEFRKLPVQTINLLLQQYHLPHDGRKHDKIDRLATAMFPPTSASVASSQARQALATSGRHPATRPHQSTQDLVDVDVLRSIVTDAISPLQRSFEDLESRVQSCLTVITLATEPDLIRIPGNAQQPINLQATANDAKVLRLNHHLVAPQMTRTTLTTQASGKFQLRHRDDRLAGT